MDDWSWCGIPEFLRKAELWAGESSLCPCGSVWLKCFARTGTQEEACLGL